MKRRDFMSQTAGLGALIAAGAIPSSLTGEFLPVDETSTFARVPVV